MIREATIQDKELANSILNHESVIDHICDDNDMENLPLDAGPVLGVPGIFILTDGKYCVFILRQVNSITFEVHSAVLPEGRGKTAVELGRSALSWMFQNTRCQKVITWIPSGNLPAYALARKCGMSREGVSLKSFLKNEVLHDQILAGITREEFQCQQQR